MNRIVISERLKLVAGQVPKGSRLADVGTDHGYVPIYLVLQGKIDHALAMDVRPGPLLHAKEHVKQYGLDGQIETRLSDGLLELRPKEADTVVIAGMGGELVIKIMDEGKHVRQDIKTWVLSPQSELSKVRHYLEENGFTIQAEHMMTEDGKYYTVMVVENGTMHYTREIDYLYGRYLIQNKDEILKAYLEKEEHMLQDILFHLKEQQKSDIVTGRITELMQKLDQNREAQYEMQ